MPEKTDKTTDKAKEAEALAAAVSNVEVPSIVRPRESSIPRVVLEALAKAFGNGWTGIPSMTFETKKDAQNSASQYKRGLATTLRIEEKEIASRTYETEDGKFVWALGPREAKS